jgi:archaellum component FlaC
MSEEQYETLRKQNAEILNYLSSIARDVGEFKQETLKRLDRLEKEVAEMKAEIAGLKMEVNKLTDRVERLEYAIGHIANDVLQLRVVDSKLSDRITKLEELAA